MKYFIIKRTWRIHNYGKKCDFVNYLTEPIFTNCFGREAFFPDINKAFVFDGLPLKPYLGDGTELTAKSFYPEGDFVDTEHITPDFAFKQEWVEVEVEYETVNIQNIEMLVRIKKK